MTEGVAWQFDRVKQQDHRGLTLEKLGRLPLDTGEQHHSIASSCTRNCIGFSLPEDNPEVTNLAIDFEAF